MSSEKASMRDVIATVAGPRTWNDTRESWLARAARRANISYRSAKSLWYGEINDAEHKAARRMVKAAEQHGRDEARELAGRFESIAVALGATDADFHREDVVALLYAARALRGLACPGNDGE